VESLRCSNALSRNLVLPFLGFLGIALHSDTFFVKPRKSRLRCGVTLLRGFSTPFESLLFIPRHSAAGQMVIGDLPLRLEVPLVSGP